MPTERSRGTFAITACSASDVPEIAALDRSMWGDSANPNTLYRQLIDIFPRMVLVARDSSGALAGFSVMLFNGATSHGWILSVDLHQDFRGQGLGRSLVSAMLEELGSLGAARVTAIIDPSNQVSQRLFRSFGFERRATERDYFGPSKDQDRWERSI